MKLIQLYRLIILAVVLVLQGCDKEECTRIDTIGGGLLPKQTIEVPCDFPEPKPLEEI